MRSPIGQYSRVKDIIEGFGGERFTLYMISAKSNEQARTSSKLNRISEPAASARLREINRDYKKMGKQIVHAKEPGKNTVWYWVEPYCGEQVA